MSIRFSVELNDPPVENLLRYLKDQFGDNEVHKLEVLSCARQWLQLEAPTVFTRGEDHTLPSVLLAIDPVCQSGD